MFDASRTSLLCAGLIGLLAPAVSGQFTAQGVTLNAQIPLSGFSSNPANGNDCWGYTSSSGREYALMGLSSAIAVVEITDPNSPVIVDEISHTSSLWGDVKTYGNYAYAVNESGGGIDVIDLSDVDNGNVTLLGRITSGGIQSSHNVVINEDSGYLYAVGSNIFGGRPAAFDLNADPTSPAFVAAVSSAEGSYCHDAQVVTYDSGPYAGREIAFCANGPTGLDIYDVTDKGNMFRLSRTVYPNLSYCHQCWLSEDGQYLYANDETDNINETIVLDVSDLAKPFIAGSYNAGIAATDHNIYVHEGMIYEAEYHGGLRIYDATVDPTNPTQVAWFDTYPENDGGGYDGAWSTYPYFPSGRIIISDIDRGLFVVTQTAPLIEFDYPNGRPDLINPAGDSVRVSITELEAGGLVPGSGLLHYRAGEEFVTSALVDVGGGEYDAVFPEIACGVDVDYYVSAQMSDDNQLTSPIGAPGAFWRATAAVAETVGTNLDMESGDGWTVVDIDLTDGGWDRGVPLGGGDRGDPANDYDGSGQCWLTDNEDGNSDIDGGPTQLTSPQIATAGFVDPYMSYARWFTNDDADIDRLDVEISDDDGASWTLVESVPGGTGWTEKTIRIADFVDPAGQIRMRFSATDNPNDSVSEAAIDALRVLEYECESGLVGDVDNDGDVDFTDLLNLLSQWGPCGAPPCATDLNGSGATDFGDLLLLLSNWTG